MSDTPRTDNFLKAKVYGRTTGSWADFAKGLERELGASRPEARLTWAAVEGNPEVFLQAASGVVRACLWHRPILYAKRYKDGKWFMTTFDTPLPQNGGPK